MGDKNNVVTVVIFDSNEARARAVLDAFDEAGADAMWITKSGKERVITPERKTVPDNVDLVVIHAGDASILENLKLRFPGVKHVYYSGRGGNDPRIPLGAQRIWRTVSTASEGLTTKEVSQLVDYASGASEPALLRPPRSFPLLRTLGILCVGYLAVQTAKAFGRSGLVPKEDATHPLGWHALSTEDRTRLTVGPEGLLSHEEEVRTGKWWRDLVKIAVGSLDKEQVLKQLRAEIGDAREKGLRDPIAVQELVKQLLENGDHAPAPEIIEPAFRALCDLDQW